MLPPLEQVRGKPTTPSWVMAQLLTRYRSRPKSETRDDFIVRVANEGFRFYNRYIRGEWTSDETVATHLKDAEKRTKVDMDFRTGVDCCVDWVKAHPPELSICWWQLELVYSYGIKGVAVAFYDGPPTAGPTLTDE
jgi:hypothetical protein